MINDYDPSGKPFCIPCIPFRIPCFCVRWSRYDPFVVFFLDFLISMMIKIWNYISATLRIWEAICWMAEGGSKKRCYCPSRKRTRSAAKWFARGAPFVRFNTITWQSTFDPAMLSYWNLLYYCAWRCFAFKPDEPDLFLIGTDGGEVKYNWNYKFLHYRQPLWTHDGLLYPLLFELSWKHCPGVHGDNKVCLRVLDAVPGTHHSCQQCQVQSFCAGGSNISMTIDKMRMRTTVSSSFTPALEQRSIWTSSPLVSVLLIKWSV